MLMNIVNYTKHSIRLFTAWIDYGKILEYEMPKRKWSRFSKVSRWTQNRILQQGKVTPDLSSSESEGELSASPVTV